jgi:hemolysin activation/secretion protein
MPSAARPFVAFLAFGGCLGLVAPAAGQAAFADDALVRVETVSFAEIAVEGSSVFAREELEALTAPYENRPISFETLQELRQYLSRRYVERGYVTSGVVLPDQAARDGEIVLRAIEGELTAVVVEGNRRLRTRAIERRISHYLDTPLNLADLQLGLRNLQNDPLVERVNAALEPGSAPGQSLLRVDVAERRPLELTVLAGNDRSTAVGEHHATIGVTYRGLIGNGDVVGGHFGGTEGARDNALEYGVPLSPGGAALDIRVSEQDADIVEEPFAAIDITSRIETFSATASRPFVDTGERALRGFVSFEHKRSESTLLDTPFSFSPGEIDGKARGSALNLGVEWTHRRGAHALVARATAQMGVDAVDATMNAEGPDSDFVAFIGQLQYARRIAWRDSRLLVRGFMQLADEALLAMYKLPVGGRYSVRGYRENQLVRDQGLSASVEYQFPALVDASGQRRGKLDLAVFADYGVSLDESELLTVSRREHLASVGFGLLWDPLPGLHLEAYRGVELAEQDNPRESLQDRGIHYNLVFRRAF